MADEEPFVPHPADPLLVALETTYREAQARLELLVAEGVRRGLDPLRAGTANAQRGDALAAYRLRQLARINQELDRIAAMFMADAGTLPVISYRAGVNAVAPASAAVLAQPAHRRAVGVLVGNLSRGLQRAVKQVKHNTAELFTLASQLGSPMSAERRALTGVTFLGRRVDDSVRDATLRSIAEGLSAGSTRKEISQSLVDRMVREGTASSMRGYTDSAGRQWNLESYARMAVRTTTREAMTVGTATRMDDAGLDLVTISKHPHKHDDCSPWEGRTGSLTGKTKGYPKILLPPYHPNCKHVMGPATQNLDDFEARLRAEVASLMK